MGLPPVPPAAIDYAQLYKAGRQNRPELAAALLGIERDEKRIELARKDYWPSFNVGASFVNVEPRSLMPGAAAIDQNGKNIYSFNLGINLPVHRASTTRRSPKPPSRKPPRPTDIGTPSIWSKPPFAKSVSASKPCASQISLFNNTLIPQAQQSLQSAEAAYSTGGLGVLDLLDSERVLLEVRLGLASTPPTI